MRIGIVGAGLAAIACARVLQASGHDVTLFERGSVGGRLGSIDLGGTLVDGGAQFFTARDPVFVGVVDGLLASGDVAPWEARIGRLRDGGFELDDRGTVRYAGVPTMNRLAEALAEDLTVVRVSVKRAERDGGAWTIEGSAGPADVLVLAMPPGDARSLVSVPGVDAVVVEPCLAVSCSFDERVSVEWDAAFVESSLLGWVARDSSKPGRPDGERWVLHGSPAWSREYFEASEGWVVEAALTEFRRLAGTAPKPTAVAVKRWRWALPTQPLGARHVWDPEQRLGLCGDWCGGPRVEGAWLSGTSLAGAILREFG